jgi:hypothetical protein
MACGKLERKLNKKQHAELDQEITNILRDLPYLRWMPSSDAAFFKRKKEKVKRYRLKRKELWVAEATQILNAFTDSLDATSDAFVNYFPPRRTPLPATALVGTLYLASLDARVWI